MVILWLSFVGFWDDAKPRMWLFPTNSAIMCEAMRPQAERMLRLDGYADIKSGCSTKE